MESTEAIIDGLDTEFDQMLVEMKPHVLRLPHKSERQRCALWIKKFCDPPATGITGRKNRNMYAQLLLHMLKRGSLEGPYTGRPEHGPLPTLPAYMSIYFDDMKSSEFGAEKKHVPSWVEGELGSTMSSLRASSSAPITSSPILKSSRPRYSGMISSPEEKPRRAQSSMGYPTERSHSPTIGRLYGEEERRVPPVHLEEFVRTDRNGYDSDSSLPYFSKYQPSKKHGGEDGDWRKPDFAMSGITGVTASTFRDDVVPMRGHEREMDMRGKMLEARFQEDKLKLQQKHDSNVQKILDRKNNEISELKTHYRSKTKEQDETISKLEKKMQSFQNELSNMSKHKDHQITELKKLTEDTSVTKQNEFEKKIHDTVAKFEQEKFDMQKQHTKNIQELLDDTNMRLQKMEDEYNQQSNATSAVIKDLESRTIQLTSEIEHVSHVRNQLEREKAELEGKNERLNGDIMDYQSKYQTTEHENNRLVKEHEQELRSLNNKLQAEIEFMKQEQNLQSVKTTDTITDLEQHVSQLKKDIEKAEQQRQRQVRELEQMQQQDKLHLEHIHEKKLRNLQKEIDEIEQGSQKKTRKFEMIIKEKEDDIIKLTDQLKQQAQESEYALKEFKSQVERNSSKMYEDMKQQMQRVEADLNKSKSLREKQAKEFQKQMDEQRRVYEQQIADLKNEYNQERSQMLREIHHQRETTKSEHDTEIERLKDTMRSDKQVVETKAQERHHQITVAKSELEKQVQKLREDLVQSNQLRKQQLVELGLLREEERQRMSHEHEGEISKLKSLMESQKLELQKHHSGEMEQQLERTNVRLKDIEREYASRVSKLSDTNGELQRTIQRIKESDSQHRVDAERQLTQSCARYEEEKRSMKKQNHSSLIGAQEEVEAQKVKIRQLERKINQLEQDYEEKMSSLRSQYEDRLRGLMPEIVRQELEDTIHSLKSQVESLQQRCLILQEEADMRNRYPLGNSLGTTHGSSMSIKS